jgi:hypothetical protein
MWRILRAVLRATVNGVRSDTRFVHSPLEIKDWVARPPSVEAARPARCPCCGTASRPEGAALMLHGHGVRERQVRGPAGPGEQPVERSVILRRYLCLACGAVIVVGPCDIEPGWLFSRPAIAWALWLFGVAKLAAATVRRQLSPWATVGATAAAGWATLRRWARAVRDRALLAVVRRCPAEWSPRQVAARAATTVAALALPADRAMAQDHQVWRGAVTLGRAIAM